MARARQRAAALPASSNGLRPPPALAAAIELRRRSIGAPGGSQVKGGSQSMGERLQEFAEDVTDKVKEAGEDVKARSGSGPAARSGAAGSGSGGLRQAGLVAELLQCFCCAAGGGLTPFGAAVPTDLTFACC